jgi:hypothetical protein
MGGERKGNPIVAKDGTIPLTVRLPIELRARLYERVERDGMKLGTLIVKLLDFGLRESETLFVRRSSAAGLDVTAAEPRRRAGGAR